MRLTERAPAKVNLALHVLGRCPNGFHELESLVAFAGCADLLTLDPGLDLALAVEGPTASAAGPDDDNLVLRAARNLLRIAPELCGGRFRLVKRLPAAAGLGGGSSDAAGALRLLARANGLQADDARLYAAARQTGADVSVCLEPRARVMSGIGEKLGPPFDLPALCCVLVNPGKPVETRAVFQSMGLTPGQRAPRRRGLDFEAGGSGRGLIARLRDAANDLQSAACAIEPAITDVLGALEQTEACLLARMSGSGATCFGLYESCREAASAAARLRAARSEWWVRATALR